MLSAQLGTGRLHLEPEVRGTSTIIRHFMLFLFTALLSTPVASQSDPKLEQARPPLLGLALDVNRGLQRVDSTSAPTVITLRRHALVIGNGAYRVGGRLVNTIPDAKRVADALRELEFEVDERHDLKRAEFSRAIADYETRLGKSGGVGFFYYSGHGIQIAGKNYLLPVDADLQAPRYAESEAINLRILLDAQHRAGNRLNIVVLDACRNNPFADRFTAANKATQQRGLAFSQVPVGTYIAYATAPGEVASDSGLYAWSLAYQMAVPGQRLEDIFINVRRQVRSATQGHQVPWESSSIEGVFIPKPATETLATNPLAVEAFEPELTVQMGHSGGVYAVAFSPDGRLIVSGSQDNTLKLWDTASGGLQRTIQGHLSIVSAVSFTPDGRKIISGGWDSTLRIWDVASGSLLRTLHGHTGTVSAVAFSPDGRQFVSSSQDNTLKIWDTANGNLLHTLHGHSDYVTDVTFSPNGGEVVSSSWDSTLRIWDASSGDVIRTVDEGSQVFAVSFAPDGKEIISASGELNRWSAASGDLLRTWRASLEDNVSFRADEVAFSPDGRKIVSNGYTGLLIVWDAFTGSLLHTLYGSDSVGAFAFSPDGRQIVASSPGGRLKLWDIAGGRLLRSLGARSLQVEDVAISPRENHFISVDSDNTLKLWNATNGHLAHVFGGSSDSVSAVAFSPDGQHVASGSYNTLDLWAAGSRRLLRALEGDFGRINAIDFSPDGRLVALGSGKSYSCGRTRTKKSEWCDKVPSLILFSIGHVQLWGVSNGELLQSFRGHINPEYGIPEPVNTVAFSPDGELIASGSLGHTVKLWDVVTGQLSRTLEGHSNYINSVAFSPDGRHLVSGGGDRTLKLWDVDGGRLLRTLRGHSDHVQAVVFSSDGRQILSGSRDKTIKLWDAASGRLLRTLRGHTYAVSAVDFSYDGLRIVSGSWDGSLRLWNSHTGAELMVLHSFEDGSGVAVTPEGYFTASNSGEKHLRVTVGLRSESLGKYRARFARFARPD